RRLGLLHLGDQRAVVDGDAVEERLPFAGDQHRERLLHRLAAVRRARKLHLDGLLDDVAGGHHEDDQQHERDVDQGGDVDPGDALVLCLRGAARHQRAPFFTCNPLAIAFPSALERPITRLSSRWKMLNASTAGMATKSPTAVATSASEMPAITNEAVLPPPPLFAAARSANARMIPSTVPKSPMNGALFPSVPRTNNHFSYSSRRRSMVDCTAFSTAGVPPSATLAADRTTSDSIESLVASAAAPFRSPLRQSSSSRGKSFDIRRLPKYIPRSTITATESTESASNSQSTQPAPSRVNASSLSAITLSLP